MDFDTILRYRDETALIRETHGRCTAGNPKRAAVQFAKPFS